MPLVVFFLGFKLTKAIEAIKNQSARQHSWNMKWADMFFESHKNYQNLVATLLSNLERFRLKIEENTQNDDIGLALQNDIMQTGYKIYQQGSCLNFKFLIYKGNGLQLVNLSTNFIV